MGVNVHKWKLIVVLLISVIVTSGCTVTYNLEIKDSTVYESLYALKPNNEFSDNIESELDLNIGFAKDDSYYFAKYDMEKSIGEYESGVKTTFEYPLMIYTTQSSFVKECFDEAIFSINDDSMKIKTSNEFRCWSQFNGTLRVNITTDYVVIDHNADSFDKNVYTWTMNKDDIDDSIEIEMEKPNSVENSKEFISNSGTYLFIVIAIAVGIFGVTIYFVQSKNKKNNEI